MVDVPVYTPEQYAERLREFRTRLGAIVSYFEWIGAQVVLVIPPGNDAGFEPNRSFLSSNTSRAEREAFATEFLAARRDETTNPVHGRKGVPTIAGAPAASSPRVISGWPGVWSRPDDWEEAFRHYVAARDLDGLPMRLPVRFPVRRTRTWRPGTVARSWSTAPRNFTHGQTTVSSMTSSSLTGFTRRLNGYAVLAQAILTKLHERQVFGWSAEAPLPVVTPLDCAKRFQMDAAKWQFVCGYSAWFYRRTAFIRHDPSERLAKAARYVEAARQLKAGRPVESPAFRASGRERNRPPAEDRDLEFRGLNPQSMSIASRTATPELLGPGVRNWIEPFPFCKL